MPLRGGGVSVSPAQKKGIPQPGGPTSRRSHALPPEASTFPETYGCAHIRRVGTAEQEWHCPSDGARAGCGKWAQLSLASRTTEAGRLARRPWALPLRTEWPRAGRLSPLLANVTVGHGVHSLHMRSARLVTTASVRSSRGGWDVGSAPSSVAAVLG